MEATMRAPVGAPTKETPAAVRPALPAAVEESGNKKASKAEIRRQKSQERICKIFALFLILVALLAGFCAVYIPTNYGPEFTVEAVWGEMAACIVFFLSLAGGSWTIRNALL